MESNTVRYLLDTNAIRMLSYGCLKSMRSSNTALETTSDVDYELGERYAQKRGLVSVFKMNDSAYRKMSELLSKHESVRRLLDYYNDKGVGDVGIIAYALTVDEERLIRDKTVIVTNDKGVRTACEELGIDVVSPDEFTSIADKTSPDKVAVS